MIASQILEVDHYAERAESIIKTQGLLFALAMDTGNTETICDARDALKQAIVRALREAAKVQPNG